MLRLTTLSGGLALCALAPASGSPAGMDIRRLDGSSITTDSIDETVERLMKAAGVPGLALAILDEGEIRYLKGFGYRNVEGAEPMTADTIMAGASFTKSAFAVAVLKLVEEGALTLDRPVVEGFDPPLVEREDYRDLAGEERLGRITPRMLLSHTAGFPNWRAFNEDGRLDVKAEPGTRYMYSGEGIALLQRLVEEITAESTGTLMRELVFEPLQMTRTSMTWQPALAGEAALGYDHAGSATGHAHRGSADAAGSMDTTVHDYALFLRGLLQGEVLGPEARERMLSPQIRIRSKHQFPTTSDETTDEHDAIELSYGLGWGLFRTKHGRAYFKEGHDDGWQHYCVTFDEAKKAIILMTNSDNGESIFKELLETLLRDTFTPWEWERYVPYQDR